jgi:hypothetical protein
VHRRSRQTLGAPATSISRTRWHPLCHLQDTMPLDPIVSGSSFPRAKPTSSKLEQRISRLNGCQPATTGQHAAVDRHFPAGSQMRNTDGEVWNLDKRTEMIPSVSSATEAQRARCPSRIPLGGETVALYRFPSGKPRGQHLLQVRSMRNCSSNLCKDTLKISPKISNHMSRTRSL